MTESEQVEMLPMNLQKYPRPRSKMIFKARPKGSRDAYVEQIAERKHLPVLRQFFDIVDVRHYE